MNVTKQILSAAVLLLLGLTKVSAQANTNVLIPQNDNTKGLNNVIVGKDSGVTASNANGTETNVFVGYRTGESTAEGDSNVYVGNLTGKSNTTGSNNVAIGKNAAAANQEGIGNVSIGDAAAMRATEGSYNIHIGKDAGSYSLTGSNNIAIGPLAGTLNQGSKNIYLGNNVANQATVGMTHAGSNNTFIGNGAGNFNFAADADNQLIIHNEISGGNNTPLIKGTFDTHLLTFTGDVWVNRNYPGLIPDDLNFTGLTFGGITSAYNPLVSNANDKLLNIDENGRVVLQNMHAWSLTGNNIVDTDFLGTKNNKDLVFKRSDTKAGQLGISNSSFGVSSLIAVTTGTGNSAFGVNAMTAAVTAEGNTAMGIDALKADTDGDHNVAMGYKALLNAKGDFNTAIGSSALSLSMVNSTSDNCTAVGYQSGYNSNASGNSFFGNQSGFKTTTAGGNTFVGNWAGYNITTGTNNICIGNHAGTLSTTTASFTGSNNVFIGRVVAPNSASNGTTFGNDTAGTIILADGAGDHKLYIHSNGFTGIGLGNDNIPQNMLHVKSGVTNASGVRLQDLTSAFNPSNDNTKFLTVNASGDIVLENVEGSLTSTDTHIYKDNGTLTSDRYMDMDSHRLVFDTQEEGRVYIGDTENLLEGPSFPTPFTIDNFPALSAPDHDYRLLVEGGILTEKVKVALRNGSPSNWADYVFADNYKLMPLKEVEAFVKENKHLPGIESAEELQKSGIDLADMQRKQMEKIEELTLHLIEQNKTIEKQSNEIEELKTQVKVLLNAK